MSTLAPEALWTLTVQPVPAALGEDSTRFGPEFCDDVTPPLIAFSPEAQEAVRLPLALFATDDDDATRTWIRPRSIAPAGPAGPVAPRGPRAAWLRMATR